MPARITQQIAPEVAATVARLVAEGRLQIMAGRIVSAIDTADGIGGS